VSHRTAEVERQLSDQSPTDLPACRKRLEYRPQGVIQPSASDPALIAGSN
jgi:hypothetical protein